MRVCVLKEYLGSKNEFFLLTTNANIHTHTDLYINAVWKTKPDKNVVT